MRFSFSDAPAPGFVSAVERALKRHPELKRFLSTGSAMPGIPPVQMISNGPASPAVGESVEFAALLAIAAGVPRSLPFHHVGIHFGAPAFGGELATVGLMGAMMPGVMVGDSWWINGRNRSISALTSIDADPAGKTLPSPPDSVMAVLAIFGKAKSTMQVPLAQSPAPSITTQLAQPSPEAAGAVKAVVQDYRSRFAEVMDRAALPHDLPPSIEVLTTTSAAATTGPKKPILTRGFKPMGYDCRAGSGTFTLRRRTTGNLTVEIYMDVGTWSRSVTASYRVTGLGYTALLPLPVSKRAIGGGQYRIGDAVRWQQIVDNFAALVRELDRSFVPAVEAAAGPSPEWYSPES
jgi:hypothetical protein